MLKSVFAKSQAVLSSLERNEKRRKEKRQPILDTFVVVEYTFSKAAILELAGFENFRYSISYL